MEAKDRGGLFMGSNFEVVVDHFMGLLRGLGGFSFFARLMIYRILPGQRGVGVGSE